MSESQRQHPELPTEQVYLNRIRQLDARFKDGLGINRVITNYLDNSHKPMGARRLLKRADLVAQFVEPKDATTELIIDIERQNTKSFLKGSVAGTFVINAVHQEFVSLGSVFESLPMIGFDDTRGIVHYQHTASEGMFELANRGWKLMGEEAKDIIDSWSEQAVEDPTKQAMFTRACGLVALGGYMSHEKQLAEITVREDMEAFEQEITAFDTSHFFDDIHQLLDDQNPGE
jgi:hypothetical protein